MKTIATFLMSLIMAGWIGAIAILSVQNFSSVTLKFFQFELFPIPVGLVLAFSVGLGIVGTALIQPLVSVPNYDEEDEFED
ncbi:MAG: DUF1049 domain-containing protein [Leptolyngbyaceae cyanobacterium HOT.MB2.61]|jgi:uncharacterized integral membrane protein|nr:DUF1049 domain-containing protein [Leptolyngbyaceae cyanobacterium HOT.MB2.61]